MSPPAPGLRHVSLTVRDLDRSHAWYREVLDLETAFEERGGERRAAIMWAPGGDQMIGLVEHVDNSGEAFSPTRTGLDHVGLSSATRAELEAWAVRFDERDVDHSGVIEIPTGAILNFKDPDGIALAFFWDAESSP